MCSGGVAWAVDYIEGNDGLVTVEDHKGEEVRVIDDETLLSQSREGKFFEVWIRELGKSKEVKFIQVMCLVSFIHALVVQFFVYFRRSYFIRNT